MKFNLRENRNTAKSIDQNQQAITYEEYEKEVIRKLENKRKVELKAA